jgi:hypothetical protein
MLVLARDVRVMLCGLCRDSSFLFYLAALSCPPPQHQYRPHRDVFPHSKYASLSYPLASVVSFVPFSSLLSFTTASVRLQLFETSTPDLLACLNATPEDYSAVSKSLAGTK